MRYPNGKEFKQEIKTKKKEKNLRSVLTSANRGMGLEDDINASNEYYKEKDIAIIYKRPTPINVVKVDYSKGARITDAYFEKQSTTDYNGVYKGRYIDFEAKNTKNKTSFPLSNISVHQINHLKMVKKHGGICFFIIDFEMHNEVYLIDASKVIEFYEGNERKSIPYEYFQTNAKIIKQGYAPRLNYIDIVEEEYFK